MIWKGAKWAGWTEISSYLCIIVYNSSLKSSCGNLNIKRRQKSKRTLAQCAEVGGRTFFFFFESRATTPHLSLSCSEFFSMLSFSANSISSLAARPMLTAVGRAEVRWYRDSLMKLTGSSPPAPARSSTARLRQPTMAMAGAPRTCQGEQGEESAWRGCLLFPVPTSFSQHSRALLISLHHGDARAGS